MPISSAPIFKRTSCTATRTLEWNPLDTAPLDDAAMGKMMRELEASGVLPGFRADTAQVRANAQWSDDG